MSEPSIPFARPLAAIVATCSIALAMDAMAARPLQEEASRLRALLEAEDFAALEAVSRRSMDLSATVSDGQPVRAALYEGIKCPCRQGRDQTLSRMPGELDRIRKWQAAYPRSTAARIAEAVHFLDHAWTVRGGDYAANVPKDAWPKFHEKVAQAGRALDAMDDDAKADPHWYAARLEVATLQSMPADERAALIDAAVGRHPRYFPIHFQAAQGLAPRWGGTNESLNGYIDRAVAATRRWMGDTLYARLQWSERTPAMFRDGQAQWPRMKAAFERLVADYPDGWNLNNFARFACDAGDSRATLDLMKRIEGRIALEAWDYSMSYYANCKHGAQAASRP